MWLDLNMFGGKEYDNYLPPLNIFIFPKVTMTAWRKKHAYINSDRTVINRSLIYQSIP